MEVKSQRQDPSSSSSSSLLKDISNLKTPQNPKRFRNFTNTSPYSQSKYFTASKQTPHTSARRGVAGPISSAARSKAARRLKAFELEQVKSARKVQNEKEKSLKSLAKSLTVWLNFLFENPSSCGCDVSRLTGEVGVSGGAEVRENGKREIGVGNEVRADGGPWRGSKRQKGETTAAVAFSDSKFLALKGSLKEICSFEDLKERMRVYLSLGSCKEIFETMSQVTKNIDEGRLKMRPNCPIVTDVGMKEKAIRIFMSYNPIWLRIGLYIILGGDSLLPNGNVNTEQEVTFLRIVIEKQFFSHTGLAKNYSYNKLVEGLYRPGYFEKLGNVILKRFLLLVLILDRAKSQSCLPLKHGIDGLDGGSPLLFSSQSNIKSSRQLINDFLSSEVMHGEGNLLAHLLIIGYKVNYQQIPLTEYEFRVTDLFEDLQDGIRLCRAIQLLLHDSSILMKIVVPSDTRKKSLVNCGTALQYLKQAVVPLFDEDGTEIMADDVVNGEKEIILSLLWNMFVHLQLPLLVNKKLLAEEIFKIRGVVQEYPSSRTLLDMLLSWIQAICGSYDLSVVAFSSLVDGKAMWCLLDYYFRKEHRCSTSFEVLDDSNGEVSIVSAKDYTDAVHNFILSQKLTSLLGNFPEVLQMSDLLEHNGACSDRSVVILLVFLSSQLLVKRNTDQLNFHKLLGFNCQSEERRRLSTEKWFMQSDVVHNVKEMHQDNNEAAARNFKAIMAWWQDMAQQNQKCEPSLCTQSIAIGRNGSNIERENAARIIQSYYRRSVERCQYLRIKNAIHILQSVIRAWLSVRKSAAGIALGTGKTQESLDDKVKHDKNSCTYMTFLVERHNYVNLRRSVVTIQRAVRSCISRRQNCGYAWCTSTADLIRSAIIFQKHFRGRRARSMFVHEFGQAEKTALASKDNEVDHSCAKAAPKLKENEVDHNCANAAPELKENEVDHSCTKAATTIQHAFRQYRGRRARSMFLNEFALVDKSAILLNENEVDHSYITAAITIQHAFRQFRGRRSQSRSMFVHEFALTEEVALASKENELDHSYTKAAITIQHAFRQSRRSLRSKHSAATKIQCLYRGWVTRKSFSEQRQAVLKIQSILRCIPCFTQFHLYKEESKSAIIIQSHFRGWIARRAAHRQRYCIIMLQSRCRGWMTRKELLIRKEAASRIQSSFRYMKCRMLYLCRKQAAIQIQCFVRGEITRKRLLGASCYHNSSRVRLHGLELKIFLQCVLKLQRWWRGILLLRLKTRSAIVIQSHLQGWIARRTATREKKHIVLIQSHWKGYLERKNSKGHLLDLRLRVKKSAANVDDSKRLINRLVAALKELLSMKSVRGILHTCSTLDMATEHSLRCCEELVAAGAVGTLLKLIRSVSRSIPDQEVLKHSLSTLRNLARYPHLTEVLIETRGLVETILWEFVRNKEGYFIASELLKKICTNQKGIEAARKLPALLKRLYNLVEELARKAGNENRNVRGGGAREQADRRLKEANAILELIMSS